VDVAAYCLGDDVLHAFAVRGGVELHCVAQTVLRTDEDRSCSWGLPVLGPFATNALVRPGTATRFTVPRQRLPGPCRDFPFRCSPWAVSPNGELRPDGRRLLDETKTKQRKANASPS
jgi:hypothetical protein